MLRRKSKQGEIDDEHARLAVQRLPGLIDVAVPSAELLDDAFLLAKELDHSVYDCAYLACARRLDAPLITADQRFVSKTQQAGFGDRVRILHTSG